ncbi:transposase [Sporomusa acidovorans]|uniref:transposase n=2 Tax=Sporomusa acidovorans TaxID=112900 RepID=UPI001160AAEB
MHISGVSNNTPSKQITFEDFNQPVGMHLSPRNRWVKKAELIPWDQIETDYARLFKGFKGQIAKPARMALGALLIQIEYGYSDEETVEQIKENPYLQFFCGLPGYEYKAPFDASAMVRFRKRLTPEKLAAINEEIIKRTETARKQQKYMYDHRQHSVGQRIVNLRQPYLRPIVRGKAKAATEFGAKLDISVVNGLVRLEKQSFEAYNESELLKTEVERYRERYGCYPKRVLADKIYRNRDNLSYCKENRIRLSGPALGRPKKNTVVDKKAEYRDICERINFCFGMENMASDF